MAFATVLAIKVLGHEDTSTTLFSWAFTTHALDLLWLCVCLLLTLLATTTQTKHKVKCAFLLDVVVLECAAILELLPGKDESLLVWRDALLVLDLSLHGFDGIGAFHLKGDGLPCECLHKDLHVLVCAPH